MTVGGSRRQRGLSPELGERPSLRGQSGGAQLGDEAAYRPSTILSFTDYTPGEVGPQPQFPLCHFDVFGLTNAAVPMRQGHTQVAEVQAKPKAQQGWACPRSPPLRNRRAWGMVPQASTGQVGTQAGSSSPEIRSTPGRRSPTPSTWI